MINRKSSLLIIFIIALVFSTTISSAQIELPNQGRDNERIVNLDPIEPPEFNNDTGSVNLSSFTEKWITDEGVMDNVPDLYPTLDTRYSLITDVLWELIGDIVRLKTPRSIDLQGNNINNVSNLTVFDKIFINTAETHWMKHGSDIFNGIASNSTWFHNDDDIPGGSVTFLVSSTSEGENVTNILAQIGLNESAGVLGNSWMILPNNLSSNLTILSNCVLIAKELNKTVRVDCYTHQTGSDLIIHDDLQSFGSGFFDTGLRVEGTGDFILNGNDLNVIGNIHVLKTLIEEIGISLGSVVPLLKTSFTGGVLSPFFLITNSGSSNEWNAVADDGCFSGTCAKAGRISGGSGTATIMRTTFSTINFASQNLTFRINTTGFDSGTNFDYFNVTINSTTTVDTELYSIIDGVDVNDIIEVAIPATFDNLSEVNLKYACKVNQFAENCFLDEILYLGNATASTDLNVTRNNGLIKFGEEEDASIFYNDSIEDWVFTPTIRAKELICFNDNTARTSTSFMKLGNTQFTGDSAIRGWRNMSIIGTTGTVTINTNTTGSINMEIRGRTDPATVFTTFTLSFPASLGTGTFSNTAIFPRGLHNITTSDIFGAIVSETGSMAWDDSLFCIEVEMDQ